ncbi:MAG TPA: hypothetical protein VLG46_09440 [Anaerolineae bacterium]|nr:hypothetical protein [Anaerolineae bacterium]
MKTKRHARGWPIIIVTTGIVVALIVMANVRSPLRPILALGFLGIGPGMAFIRLLRLKERFAEFILAVALSLAIDTLVSEMLVLMRIWSLVGSVLAIVIISIVGAVLQVIVAPQPAAAAGD